MVPHTRVHHALDTRRVILTIAACLSLIAGIVLVGLGAAAILPSLFGVIGGMILILFSSIALIYLYKKTREVDQIALEPLPEMISKDQSVIGKEIGLGIDKPAEPIPMAPSREMISKDQSIIDKETGPGVDKLAELIPLEPPPEMLPKDQSVIDKEISAWIEKQIAIGRKKQPHYFVRDSPEFIQFGEKFSLADATNKALAASHADLNMFFQSCPVVLFFKNWGDHSMEEITGQQEVWVRCIVGSYGLLKKSLERFFPQLINSLFWELLHQIEHSTWIKKLHKESLNFVKTRDYASLEKKATFAYTHTHYYDGSMVFYREIPRFMLGSYLALRKDMDRQALF